MSKKFSRREVLAMGGVAALGTLPMIHTSIQAKRAPKGGMIAYRLSLRGRRGSNAAKKHNANHLFASAAAANAHRAHPGDNSRIVQVTISEVNFYKYFTGPSAQTVDLRKIKKASADPKWLRVS